MATRAPPPMKPIMNRGMEDRLCGRSAWFRQGWARVAGMAGMAGVAWGLASVSAHGQMTGLFVFPYVDAHGRGIPGVTRPMLMAGPGMLGMGMGGGMGMPVVNPNWTGAAAMFAPELLMGRGMMPGFGGGAGGPGNGTAAPVPGRWGVTTPGQPSAMGGGPEGAGNRLATTRAGQQGAPAVHRVRRDEASADARLLAFQQSEARKGLPGAQRALAARYETGDGVERSEELARAWRLAAERSEAAADLK